jgi:hypothetical protein
MSRRPKRSKTRRRKALERLLQGIGKAGLLGAAAEVGKAAVDNVGPWILAQLRHLPHLW